MKLLTIGNDAKTVKGQKQKVLTAIMYLAPHKMAGLGNVCPYASKECISLCLFTAGRARIFPEIIQARIQRTKMFREDKKTFLAKLEREIDLFSKYSRKRRLKPACRLDGTSDIGLGMTFAKKFPQVQFYDYTKNPRRMRDFLAGKFRSNYHLIFSRSENNWSQCERFLKKGAAIAAIFETLPQTYLGWPVIPGDEHDVRFMDRKLYGIPENAGYVVGLKPKGKARTSYGGMVIRTDSHQASAR